MELYIGGAFQDKLSYVLEKKGKLSVADGADCTESRLKEAQVINHLHMLIYRLISEGKSVSCLIDELYENNPEIILICDEVGSGIVPLKKKGQDLPRGGGKNTVPCGFQIREGGTDFLRNGAAPEMTDTKIILIRHGAVAGNLEKRYIGKTDEALCEQGVMQLKRNICAGLYPQASAVFDSPMKRCIQTAALIYPGVRRKCVQDLRECDFGEFEGKNYMELDGNDLYRQWIESGGKAAFPGGEEPAAFRKRCVAAFLETLAEWEKGAEDKNDNCPAFVVHGGTIMSVLSELCGGDYYGYSCKNGRGYICSRNAFGKMRVEKTI